MQQQVVVIKQVVFALELGVVIEDAVKVLAELNQVRLRLLDSLIYRAVLIDGSRDEAEYGFAVRKASARAGQAQRGRDQADDAFGIALVENRKVRTDAEMVTVAAVVVGASVILFDPIFQGLAISLMAGEVASLLFSRMTVPILYFMEKGWENKHVTA